MKYKIAIAVTVAFCISQTGLSQDSDLTAADGNSDGKVTVDEFREYAEGKLSGFEHMDQFVKAVDKNGDGEISRLEFNGRMEVLQSIAESIEHDQESSDNAPEAKKQVVKQSDGDATNARKNFEEMVSRIKKHQLEDAAKLMTQRGADEFAVSQVLAAIGMTAMELPIPVPGIDDAIDEIENVVVKYKLDKLDIDKAKMFKVEMSIDDGLDEYFDEESGDNKDNREETETDGQLDQKKSSADKAKKDLEDANKKIIAGIDKDGKRWQIINELMKAKANSPFGIVPLVGKVSKAEQQDQVAYLTVTPEMNQPGGGDAGVMVQMVAPPSVVRMTKSGDVWKFDGVDEKRTSKVMQDFMQKQNFGGAAELKDF